MALDVLLEFKVLLQLFQLYHQLVVVVAVLELVLVNQEDQVAVLLILIQLEVVILPLQLLRKVIMEEQHIVLETLARLLAEVVEQEQ